MFSRNTTAKVIDRIEMFNAVPVSEEEIEKAYKDLFDTKEDFQISENALKKILRFYVKASKLAEKNQKYHRLAGYSIYLLAPAAVAAVALGILIPHRSGYAVELIFLLAILVIWCVAQKQQWHSKWIESRFLAELIRSATFLAACGLEPLPIRIPPVMGPAHQPGDWVAKIFNGARNSLLEMSKEMPRRQGQSCTKLVEFIRKSWVQDQIRHHENRSKQAACWSHFFEYGSMFIFGLALVAAFFHLWNGAAKLECLLKFGAITLPAVGAAMEGFRSHREYPRLAKRSENMVSALKDLDGRLSKVSGPKDLADLLREAEESIVQETQDWHMLMRFTVVKLIV